MSVLPSGTVQQSNRPILTTPFFGRSAEVAEGCRLLRMPMPRLVVLTGTGGVGKTRLAIEIATNLLNDFEHGLRWVPLAAVGDPSGVLPTIARVLGLSEEGTTPLVDTVIDYPSDREMLLVLDNFEQVVDAAVLLDDLLTQAARLKLLVTSRAILRITGEHEVGVTSLGLPTERNRDGSAFQAERELIDGDRLSALMQYPAVALFVARAQTSKPDWTLTEDNAEAVAAICARLDGLPLAIELAAARTRLLSPQELLGRLQQRLRILTGGARNLLPHQQTLRSTIDWSFDLLSPADQTLFARLAVFAGGWTIGAAETICADSTVDVLDGLQRLLDESLVQHERSPRNPAETRLLMLETIREYALERLEQQGERAMLCEWHAHYFVELVEEGRTALAHAGAAQMAQLERWDADDDNVRSALTWSREAARGSAIMARLAGSLWRYWELRGRFSEGRAWLEQALMQTEADAGDTEGGAVPQVPSDRSGSSEAVASVLDGAGVLADYQGDYRRAEELYRRSLTAWEALGDERGVARAFNGLGGIAAVRGDWTEARRFYEQSLELRRALGDRSDEATTLNNLALVAFDQQQFAEAQHYFAASLQIARAVGDQRGIARGLANVGLAAMYRGEPKEAEHLLESSLAMYRTLGERSGIAHLLGNLGNLALSNGDGERALALYLESLATFHSIEDRNGIAESLEGLAREAMRRMAFGRAVRLWAAADALRAAIDAPLPPAERATYDQSLATAREALGNVGFALAWEDGHHGQLAATIEFARAASGDFTSAPPGSSPPYVAEVVSSLVSAEHATIPGGLSDREVDVLRLVARGLSAKEVATQLIISPRTVHAHLASIYGKIGVSTRVAATHFAIEHGLI